MTTAIDKAVLNLLEGLREDHIFNDDLARTISKFKRLSRDDSVSGVYLIHHDNIAVYVGSSIDVWRRFRNHKDSLERGKHHNDKLQLLYKKHKKNLVFELLQEEYDKNDLKELEVEYIKYLKPTCNSLVPAKNGGMTLTDDVKEKMKRYHNSETGRLRASLSTTNYFANPENRRRQSQRIKNYYRNKKCQKQIEKTQREQ